MPHKKYKLATCAGGGYRMALISHHKTDVVLISTDRRFGLCRIDGCLERDALSQAGAGTALRVGAAPYGRCIGQINLVLQEISGAINHLPPAGNRVVTIGEVGGVALALGAGEGNALVNRIKLANQCHTAKVDAVGGIDQTTFGDNYRHLVLPCQIPNRPSKSASGCDSSLGRKNSSGTRPQWLSG